MRIVHYLNNLRHKKSLKHNKALYKKAGLKKSIFASVSRKDFAALGNDDVPWLDKSNAAESLQANAEYQQFDATTQQQLVNWVEKGYMVLENKIDSATIDSINTQVEKGITDSSLHYDYTNSRVMNAYQQINAVKEVAKNKEINQLLNFVMGKNVVPFQTINFIHGSKAKAHSDFIHMTTEPLGYLCAIWVALEDIHADSGPVHYYEGSHKLPYLFNEDFETGNTRFMVGDDYYENYTDAVEEMVKEKGLQKKDFLAKKGDVLIWHANLLHGGTPVVNPNLTRKSLVVHYFCEGIICYHEITQRPAIIKAI